MSEGYWEKAQAAEFQVWGDITSSLVNVVEELADLTRFLEFTSRHGIAKADRVIELGVGPMGIGWGALSQSSTVIGVDPLPQLEVQVGVSEIDIMLAEMRRRTEYVQADATARLPYPDGSFDIVVCDNVIDHTQAPSKILEEARRLVAPDGYLLFSVNVFSFVGITKWRQVTRRLHPSSTNVVCHPHSFTEVSAREALASAGWRVQASTDGSLLARSLGRSYRWRSIATPA